MIGPARGNRGAGSSNGPGAKGADQETSFDALVDRLFRLPTVQAAKFSATTDTAAAGPSLGLPPTAHDDVQPIPPDSGLAELASLTQLFAPLPVTNTGEPQSDLDLSDGTSQSSVPGSAGARPYGRQAADLPGSDPEQTNNGVQPRSGAPDDRPPQSDSAPVRAAEARVDRAPLPPPTTSAIDPLASQALAALPQLPLARDGVTPPAPPLRGKSRPGLIASDTTSTALNTARVTPVNTVVESLARSTETGGNGLPADVDTQSSPGGETTDGRTPQSNDPSLAVATPAPAVAASQAVHAKAGPETIAHLATQIVKKLDGRATRFDVELNPAGLGRVEVRVEIGSQGQLSAAMSFDNPQAASELRSRASELQRALEQAGFDLSGGLSFNVADDRNRGGQGQFGQEPQDASGRGRAFEAVLNRQGDASGGSTGGPINLQRRTLSGVDVWI